MAGATDITIEILPMVLPRPSGGTSCMTVVISSGIMIAVPVACTTRPTTSSSSPGETAQTSVPIEKIDMARMKIGLVCSRCSRKPVIGITTAMVSRNAVVSHWAALAVTPRSSISCGIATLMMVSLRNTTKVEVSSSAITSRLRAACGAAIGMALGAASGARVSAVMWSLRFRMAGRRRNRGA